jgi:hypothetical protein
MECRISFLYLSLSFSLSLSLSLSLSVSLSLYLSFWERVSPCSSGWPGTHDPQISAFQYWSYSMPDFFFLFCVSTSCFYFVVNMKLISTIQLYPSTIRWSQFDFDFDHIQKLCTLTPPFLCFLYHNLHLLILCIH